MPQDPVDPIGQETLLADSFPACRKNPFSSDLRNLSASSTWTRLSCNSSGFSLSVLIACANMKLASSTFCGDVVISIFILLIDGVSLFSVSALCRRQFLFSVLAIVIGQIFLPFSQPRPCPAFVAEMKPLSHRQMISHQPRSVFAAMSLSSKIKLTANRIPKRNKAAFPAIW